MKKTALITCALLLLASPCQAFLGGPDQAYDLGASIRGIGVYYDNYDFAPFFGEQNDDDTAFEEILRFTLTGKATDKLRYEAHLVQTYDYTSMEAGSALFPETSDPIYRIANDTADLYSNQNNSATLYFDRLNAKLSLSFADIIIGRQAITFGKAWFWNPCDIFYPFSARAFDRDYKPGVDAILLDAPFGAFSGLTAVVAAGRKTDANGLYENDRFFDADWYGSAALLRFYGNISGWDWAAQGGKIYAGWQIGGASTGEISEIQFRAEFAAFFAESDSPDLPAPLTGPLYEDHVSAVFGLGHRFASSLDLELEFLIESGASDDLNESFARFSRGAILSASRRSLGFTVSYELSPLCTGQIAVIQSLSTTSTNIQPTLTISLSDNAELLAGFSACLGRRPTLDPIPTCNPAQPWTYIPTLHSEYGTYPSMIFLEAKQYF